MYIGRFVVVSPGIGTYCVSPRSLSDRRVAGRDDAPTVRPTPGTPETDDPYIAYNCVHEGDDYVVVGNGSQVDPAAEKLNLSHPPRDALVEILLALNHEKGDYDMPRITGVVGGDEAYIGIVREGALVVEAVVEPTLVATYEEDDPRTLDLSAKTAVDVARELYDHESKHTVCAAATIVSDAVETSFCNGE